MTTTQDDVVAIQRDLVASERQLSQALEAEPTPELIRHLVADVRLESAKRLQKQMSYLIRLETRTVDQFEMKKASTVQDRIRGQQRALLLALGADQ